MKKSIFTVLTTVFLVGLIFSCATGPYKPSGPDDKVIGSVRATFEAGPRNSKRFYNEHAYTALLEAAQKEHKGNIDIRDITWTMGKCISGIPSTPFSTYVFQ